MTKTDAQIQTTEAGFHKVMTAATQAVIKRETAMTEKHLHLDTRAVIDVAAMTATMMIDVNHTDDLLILHIQMTGAAPTAMTGHTIKTGHLVEKEAAASTDLITSDNISHLTDQRKDRHTARHLLK